MEKSSNKVYLFPNGNYPAKEPDYSVWSWIKFYWDVLPEMWRLGRDILRFGAAEVEKLNEKYPEKKNNGDMDKDRKE